MLQQRITDGYRPAKHMLAKHMVSIRHRSPALGFVHACGGSIIKPRIILTATHCGIQQDDGVYEFIPKLIEIAAGSPIRFNNPATKIFKLQRALKHPKYELWKNDIALLFLTQDIVEDGLTMQRVPLVSKKPAEGAICTAAGWGRILYNGPVATEVTYIDVTIHGKEACSKPLGLIYLPGLICAKKLIGKMDAGGVCHGDSGGPLFCGGKLAGIASLVLVVCGATGNPDYYTNVWYFRDWIEANCASDRQVVYKWCLVLAMFVMFWL